MSRARFEADQRCARWAHACPSTAWSCKHLLNPFLFLPPTRCMTPQGHPKTVASKAPSWWKPPRAAAPSAAATHPAATPAVVVPGGAEKPPGSVALRSQLQLQTPPLLPPRADTSTSGVPGQAVLAQVGVVHDKACEPMLTMLTASRIFSCWVDMF